MENNLREIVEKHLLTVQKPGRYTGGELNSVVKNDAAVRMAISYPDMYEVGMSNNGIRILYDIVNSMESAACERVFSPDLDFEELLRRENIPLYTLESFTPLHQLDLLAFNLSHELLYTNMLQILDLGGIPLLSGERGEVHPIVIAGGSAVSNPMPSAGFLDAVFLGDGEEGIREIVEVLINTAGGKYSRKERVKQLGEIEGILLPGDYSSEYIDGKLAAVHGRRVVKRSFRCEKPHNPLKPIVPSIRITQERAVFEITRGCSNMCKFCHAGYYDLPYRGFGIKDAADGISTIINNTGYSELSLLSLSVSDFRELPELLNSILPELSARGVSVSLPSMKVDMETLPVIEIVSDLRKSSLTFAVESASDEIRSLSYKRVNTRHLLSIIEHVFNSGWNHIKLYFMIGLPGCDEFDEAAAIVSLLREIIQIPGRKKNINVTISPFIPKPHTPFEREKQMGEDYFLDTVIFIKKNLPPYIKIKSHNVNASVLEGVLSRGDSRLGDVILKAYNSGCRFDSWSEHFNFRAWVNALDDTVVNWRDYLEEKYADQVLPWGIIGTGFEKVKEAMKKKVLDLDNYERKPANIRERLNIEGIGKGSSLFTGRYRVEKRARLLLSKRGLSRFIPHIDFIEVIKRGLRMADAPVSFTQGFNKREKISMGFPLPLGIESEYEICDIELFGELLQDFKDRFNSRLPEGIRLNSFRYFEDKRSLMSISGAAGFEIKINDSRMLRAARDNCDKKVEFIKKSKRGEKRVPFDEAVESIIFRDDESVYIMLHTGTGTSVRIDSVLETLTGDENFRDHVDILKTGTFTGIDGELQLID